VEEKKRITTFYSERAPPPVELRIFTLEARALYVAEYRLPVPIRPGKESRINYNGSEQRSGRICSNEQCNPGIGLKVLLRFRKRSEDGLLTPSN